MRSFQDRIIGLERISSDELDDHPGNWRDHTDEQVSALLGVLGEVGIADALLAYRSERNGGRMAEHREACGITRCPASGCSPITARALAAKLTADYTLPGEALYD